MLSLSEPLPTFLALAAETRVNNVAWELCTSNFVVDFESQRPRAIKRELINEAQRLAAVDREAGWTSMFGSLARQQFNELVEKAGEFFRENRLDFLRNSYFDMLRRVVGVEVSPELLDALTCPYTYVEPRLFLCLTSSSATSSGSNGIPVFLWKIRRAGLRLAGFFGFSKVDARNNP